jgi:hypothetical protein
VRTPYFGSPAFRAVIWVPFVLEPWSVRSAPLTLRTPKQFSMSSSQEFSAGRRKAFGTTRRSIMRLGVQIVSHSVV